jgi:hypothetical protein
MHPLRKLEGRRRRVDREKEQFHWDKGCGKMRQINKWHCWVKGQMHMLFLVDIIKITP